MPKRIQKSISFETQEELENAESQISSGISFSDYVRAKAFSLPHRSTKGGAPRGNKNNPHGRRRNKEAI